MLLSIPELIEHSWKVYTHHWKKNMAYGLVLFLSSFLPLIFVFELAGINALLTTFISSWEAIIAINAIVVPLSVLVLAVINFWIIARYTRAAQQMITPNAPVASKRPLLKVALSVLFVYIFYTAAIFVGTLALVIPGIYLGILFAFSTYEVILNDTRGFEALRKSSQLISGRWWAILVRIMGPALLYGIAFIALDLVLTFALDQLPETLGFVLKLIKSTLLYANLVPLSMITGVMLYLSAKNNPVEVSE